MANLFETDAYMKEFQTKIIRINKENKTIELEDTAFYAKGGGQPGDIGEVVLNDRVLKVIDTQKGSSPKEIQHIIEGEIDQYLIGKFLQFLRHVQQII